jgi:hypothetical protein
VIIIFWNLFEYHAPPTSTLPSNFKIEYTVEEGFATNCNAEEEAYSGSYY